MRKNKLKLQRLTLENLKILNLILELIKIVLFTPLLMYLYNSSFTQMFGVTSINFEVSMKLLLIIFLIKSFLTINLESNNNK